MLTYKMNFDKGTNKEIKFARAKYIGGVKQCKIFGKKVI